MARDANYDLVRDPDEWTTGDEPITDTQREYLLALSKKAGEQMSEEDLNQLTKAAASERIDELQQ